ncbi:MAG: PP2C family protein-serine/threonine phosphatase [Devosia sp.]
MSRYKHTRTADVGIGALESILSQLPIQRLQAGQVLLRQGERSEYAYYLVEGEVAVFAESEYGRAQLASLQAPRLIGELGVLAEFPRTATIEATTPVAMRRLTREQLIEIGRTTPDFLFSVIGQLGVQLDGMNRALSLYGNALSALERREFDQRILDELVHPSPQLVTFANTFQRFAEQIIDKRRQNDELASAALIQRSFLPRPELLKPVAGRLELSADMRPARDVGGDFYDYFMLDRHRVAVAIGDVCGKGIPASLFMAVAITTLRTAAQEEKDVVATLRRTNASLCHDNDASMFATLFFAVLDTRTGELEYGNCGHNAPYVLTTSGRTSLPATGVPVGLVADRSARSERIVLGRGDRLVLYTDGVTEAMNPDQAEFGVPRLEALLDQESALPPAELLGRVFDEVDRFAAGEMQADDITALTLRLV